MPCPTEIQRSFLYAALIAAPGAAVAAAASPADPLTLRDDKARMVAASQRREKDDVRHA